MKAYLVTTGAVFGLITIAHLLRILVEWPALATDPWYLLVTAVAAAPDSRFWAPWAGRAWSACARGWLGLGAGRALAQQTLTLAAPRLSLSRFAGEGRGPSVGLFLSASRERSGSGRVRRRTAGEWVGYTRLEDALLALVASQEAEVDLIGENLASRSG